MKNIAPLILLVLLGSARWLSGAEIVAQGGAVLVPAGDYLVAGRTVKVVQPATLHVAAAPLVAVKDEPLKLSAVKPAGWKDGTRLRGCNAKDTNACGSFVPGSLEIRRAAGSGELLTEGKDYLIDSAWGQVGLGPETSLTPRDEVFASYRYSLLRIDTIEASAEGKASLKVGVPHISVPVPPEADAGCTAIAHVFANYRDSEAESERIYPILESSAQAVTATRPGRIPKTLAKLRAGSPVKIVCWGDSVTAGGNASEPKFRYVDVFAAGLRERFPQAKIEVENISVGGSASPQWLHPDKYPFHGKRGEASPCQFGRVLATKPDLVTVEFVNDAGLPAAAVEDRYGEILQRVQGIGAELILITPHFTMERMMGFRGLREAERRPYVLALREFAAKHQVALADASARWEHLWKEGVPYLTLLHNTINHPDDRGHRLFAEELWKCFQ